jgi:hypothetical protein
MNNNIEFTKIENYNKYSIIHFTTIIRPICFTVYKTPVANCGLASIAGVNKFQFLSKEHVDFVLDIITEKVINKHLLFCNDTVDSYNTYKHSVEHVLFTEPQQYLNPSSGNECVNFMLKLPKN